MAIIDSAKQFRIWICRHWMLGIVTALALGQVPLSVLYLTGGETTTQQSSKQKAHQRSKKNFSQHRLPPALPSRTDPFQPLPTNSDTASSQADIPALAKILSGSQIEESLPVFGSEENASLPPPSALLKPSPKPSAVAINQTEPKTQRRQDPLRQNLIQNPRLKGVIHFKNRHIAVFETQAGKLVYVRSLERIPNSQLVVKSIDENSALLVNRSPDSSQAIEVLVGKQVDE